MASYLGSKVQADYVSRIHESVVCMSRCEAAQDTLVYLKN